MSQGRVRKPQIDVRRNPYVGRATQENRCWFKVIPEPNNACNFCKPRSSTTPKISKYVKCRNCFNELKKSDNVRLCEREREREISYA